MKTLPWLVLTLGLVLSGLTASGCKQRAAKKSSQAPPPPAAMQPVMTPGPGAGMTARPAPGRAEVQMKADAFLTKYQTELARLEKAQTTAYWKAANSGKKADFAAAAKAELALKQLHSDPGQYRTVLALRKQAGSLKPLTRRSLQVAELAFKGNQLPKPLLEKLVKSSTEIEQVFNTFRGKIKGKAYTNNQLLERLRKERSTARRKEVWEALKQVGDAVGPKLVALAKLRNQAAIKLGFANYWDMKIRLQEHDPKRILTIFAELEQLTNAPFRRMKAKLDSELSQKLKVKPGELMPWHYDNPFFQAPPPSAQVDLDSLWKGRKKEQIVAFAKTFYAGLGLPIDDIVKRSDLYERKGKDQHAFCITIDRGADIRTLLNIKPTAEWMDTMLHEQGHAVYYKHVDRTLPFNLREAAHIFTTEAVAMLFGALAKAPGWLVASAGMDAKRVGALAPALLEQRRREQLIFTRWTLVMLNFEKALYENPDRDLNKLWWDHVERYQGLKRPPTRNHADWASKPHFTIAPVYYHNYMLGELFAAQLRATLAKRFQTQDPAAIFSSPSKKKIGAFFVEKIFRPGMRYRWPEYVRRATGHALTAKHFAAEVK